MTNHTQRIVALKARLAARAQACRLATTRCVRALGQASGLTRLQVLLALTLLQQLVNCALTADALVGIADATTTPHSTRAFAVGLAVYFGAFSLMAAFVTLRLKRAAIRHDSLLALVSAAVCTLVVGVTPLFDPIVTDQAVRDVPHMPGRSMSRGAQAALAAVSLCAALADWWGLLRISRRADFGWHHSMRLRTDPIKQRIFPVLRAFSTVLEIDVLLALPLGVVFRAQSRPPLHPFTPRPATLSPVSHHECHATSAARHPRAAPIA